MIKNDEKKFLNQNFWDFKFGGKFGPRQLLNTMPAPIDKWCRMGSGWAQLDDLGVK